MTLSSIEAVRLTAADKSLITREEGKGDADARFWKLAHSNISLLPAIEIRLNGVVQVAGYTLDDVQGIVTFAVAPALNVEIEFTYYWSQFSDAEIQFFLDDSGGSTTIASAKLLLAIAASASKVAERQSLAGGGGLGAVTIDTSVAARELRNTAKALVDQAILLDNIDPAEGITEINWTEFQYVDSLGQRIIRNN